MLTLQWLDGHTVCDDLIGLHTIHELIWACGYPEMNKDAETSSA